MRQAKCLFWVILGLTLAAPLASADDDSQVEAEHDAATDGPLAQDEYYELFQVFADTLEQVERNYVEPISRRELMEAAIEGLLGKLDPYSTYIAPEEISDFRTSVESRFGGVGIQIRWNDDDLTVVTPLVGTPAYLAGLQTGDRIVAIDGQSMAAVAAEFTSIDARVSRAVELLKGTPGSTVDVTFRHADAPAKTVTLTREVVRVATVLGDHRDSVDAWDFMFDDKLKIGYVRITSFSRDTPDELRQALIALTEGGMKGLILDLRFDPGGLLTSAVEVCDMFVADGRIVSTQGRNVRERVWDAHAAHTFDNFPMAVLVNHLSASASEIVAACLQDHDRAVIIGERTWGKGSVQNVIELEHGRSALKLTTASYVRPNGKNIHRFPGADEDDEWGVTPNEGFDVRLSADETRRMLAARAERDVLHTSHAPVLLATADTSEGGPERPESATKPADAEAAPPPTSEGAPPDDPSGNAESDAGPAGAADVQNVAPESAAEPDAGSGADETAPVVESADAASGEGTDGADQPYIDRQFKAALDYLKGKIRQ
ncbi:MAG: PDZ domain-containing protein [Planctomycetales bacterium]|nr:PDZ domain-containing protein [Planctomycetales bacterium]